MAAAAELLSPLLLNFFLTFCRIGAAFMLFPAFTDSVPQQSRLVAALAVSLPLSLLAGIPAPDQGDMSGIIYAIAANITLGVYFGLVSRILLSAFQMGGQMIGQLSGLYNPFNSSGLAFEGSTIVSTIMVISGTALIFASDLHLHFIVALAGSFETVSLAGTVDPSVLNSGIVHIVSKAFKLGVQFAAPFIVLGLVFNLALGVCNRMMPALPVYFVFSPVLIFIGLFLIIVVFGAIASLFVSEMTSTITGI